MRGLQGLVPFPNIFPINTIWRLSGTICFLPLTSTNPNWGNGGHVWPDTLRTQGRVQCLNVESSKAIVIQSALPTLLTISSVLPRSSMSSVLLGSGSPAWRRRKQHRKLVMPQQSDQSLPPSPTPRAIFQKHTNRGKNFRQKIESVFHFSPSKNRVRRSFYAWLFYLFDSVFQRKNYFDIFFSASPLKYQCFTDPRTSETRECL